MKERVLVYDRYLVVLGSNFRKGTEYYFQDVGVDRAVLIGLSMGGIIAQEMGEVVRGSIHYRALFMVGLALFGLTLVINLAAQKITARYRMSIG